PTLRADIVPPPPEEAQRVEEIRALLAEADAAIDAGEFEEGLQTAERAQARLADLSWGLLRPEVALVVGRAQERTAAYADAAATLRLALRDGAAQARWSIAGRAATELVQVTG